MSARGRVANKSRMRDWAVYCGLFLSTLDTGIVTVALKPIAMVFGVSLPIAGLSMTFYLFALIAMLIPGGWLGDRFGCERMLAVGFAVFGGASLVCGGSSTIALLILGRALQGVGAALIQGNALGYVAKQPPDRRLHMSTMMTAAISIGPILGPSLGGWIVEVVGWPWLFLVNIPFCLAGFLIAWRGDDATVEFSSKSPDFKELVLFALLIGLAAWLLYAINTDASIQLIAVSALSMSATAIGFGRYEWRHRFPLIPVAALARRTPAFIATGAFVFGYAAGVFFAAAPIVLLSDTEKTLSIVGIITSAAPAGLFIGAFIRRHMSARFSDLRAMQAGSLTMFSAFVLFAAPMTATEPGFFAASAALYGIGGGVFQVSNIKSASKITPDRPSMAGSLLRLFQNLGIALGATVALYSLRHGIELPTSVISRTSVLWGSTAVVLVALSGLSTFRDAGHYEA